MGAAAGRMRFDVNCSILFPEIPLLDRPAAAAALGFDAVELWWPFATESPPPAEVDRLVDATALERAGYDGYVGLEYRPSPDPDETFAWLPPERRRSPAGAQPRSVLGRSVGQ